MLTTYASCWGSFVLRGAALILLGVALLAPSLPALALPALALLLIVGAANAISTGLRMRSSSSGWWLPMAEAIVSFLLAAAILAARPADAARLALVVAMLSALDGLLLFGLAWRHRRGAYPVGPVAGAGALSIGFGWLLAQYPSMANGSADDVAGVVALALGAASWLVALRLRGIVRAVRHELLRDAPLACRPSVRADRGQRASLTAGAVRVPA